MSLAVATTLMFMLVTWDSPPLWKGLYLVFFLSTIWDFFVNIIPSRQAIILHDGSSTYNDGAQIRRLWQEQNMPDVYFEGLKANAAGEYEQAALLFEQAIKLSGPKRMLKENRLSSLISAKQFQTALDFFIEQYDTQRLPVGQYQVLGDLYMQVKSYENALQAYSAYLYVVFQDAEVICKKGLALLYLGEAHLAIEEFNIALRINTQNALTYSYRGRAHLALRLWRKAEEDLEQARQLNPGLPELHLFEGMYQEEMGEYSSALTAYKKAKELGIDYHGIDFLIASAQQSQDNSHS